MDDRKQQLKLNNRGLTLVELIAAIAIIGIFGAVIASFITSGMNFYRHVSDTSAVQRSMQNTLESIENLVIDTNDTIKYQVGGVAAENDFGQENQSEKLLVMKSIREDSSGAENEVVDVLRWRPECGYQSGRNGRRGTFSINHNETWRNSITDVYGGIKKQGKNKFGILRNRIER